MMSRHRIKKSLAYPFTWHIPVEPNVVRSDIPDSDSRRERIFDEAHLIAFRDALEFVASLCRDASYVAAFAMGGLACIEYITHRNGAVGAVSLAPFREKYHVFGGLNWRSGGDRNKGVFRNWLNSLPQNASIVLFDTGRVGNSAGQLMRFICRSKQALNGPLIFQIVVLGERNRSNGTDHRTIEMRTQRISVIRDILRIDDVITEDALRLAGASQLYERWGLQPNWVQGSIRIRRRDGSITCIASASIGPAFVQSLMNGLAMLNT